MINNNKYYYYNYGYFEDCILNKSNLSFNSSLRVFHWNIRGMKCLEKFDALKEMVVRYKDPIDVIVIGETRLKREHTALYNIYGYGHIF